MQKAGHYWGWSLWEDQFTECIYTWLFPNCESLIRILSHNLILVRDLWQLMCYVSSTMLVLMHPYALPFRQENIASDHITRFPQFSKTMSRIAGLMVDLFS